MDFLIIGFSSTFNYRVEPVVNREAEVVVVQLDEGGLEVLGLAQLGGELVSLGVVGEVMEVTVGVIMMVVEVVQMTGEVITMVVEEFKLWIRLLRIPNLGMLMAVTTTVLTWNSKRRLSIDMRKPMTADRERLIK